MSNFVHDVKVMTKYQEHNLLREHIASSLKFGPRPMHTDMCVVTFEFLVKNQIVDRFAFKLLMDRIVFLYAQRNKHSKMQLIYLRHIYYFLLLTVPH